MSLANRAKLSGRAGTRQSLRLRASHGSGLGLRVSHRQSRDWRAPDKDYDAEVGMGDYYSSTSRGASDSRGPDSFRNDRKHRRKKKRRKGR